MQAVDVDGAVVGDEEELVACADGEEEPGGGEAVSSVVWLLALSSEKSMWAVSTRLVVSLVVLDAVDAVWYT